MDNSFNSIIYTSNQLNDLLDYDPKTGFLFWKFRDVRHYEEFGIETAEKKKNSFNGRYGGKLALHGKNSKGYRCGEIFHTPYLAHRVIWKMFYGADADGYIDHENRNRSDNRIENLRSVSMSENCRNQSKYKTNTSGHVGVYLYKSNSKWLAKINCEGKAYHLGYFDSFEAAVAAREEAEIRFGFHQSHGKEAVT